MKYIDIHTHIAYGLDDGAKSLEESIQFLQEAQKHQYEAIVLTPHIKEVNPTYYGQIKQRYLELHQLSNDIKLYLGSELLLNEQTGDLLKSKQFYTMNESSYLLIECDVRASYHHMLDALDTYLNTILSLGYTPIIAHIERYYKDEIDLDYVEYLIQKGCIIQINTTSILSEYTKIQPLLDQQMVHVIASDAHDLERRVLNMDDVYHILLKKHYDKIYLEDLMYHHPKSIVENRPIHIRTYKKRSLFHKLMGR